jgi:hypothetical protein
MIGVGGALIALFLRLNHKTSTFADKLRRVDWIGGVMFIGSMTGFLIGLSWGGVMYPWSSWRTLVPLIVCGFGLVAFIVYEEWLMKQGREPLIRLDVMKNRTAAVTYFGTFIRRLSLILAMNHAKLRFKTGFFFGVSCIIFLSILRESRAILQSKQELHLFHLPLQLLPWQWLSESPQR